MPTAKRNSQTPSRRRPSRQRSQAEEQREDEKSTRSHNFLSRGIHKEENQEPQQKNSQQSRVSVAAVFASQKALVSQYLESIVVDDGSDVGGKAACLDTGRSTKSDDNLVKNEELATDRERRAPKRQRSENKQKEELARGAEGDASIGGEQDTCMMASTTRGLPAKERVREACRTLTTTVKQRLADVSSDHRASMEALEDKVVTEDFLVLKEMADDFSEGVNLWIQQAKDVVKSLRDEQLRLKGYLEATQRSLGDRRRRFEEENASRSAQLDADIVAMLTATEEALSDVLPPESRRTSMSVSRRENNNDTAEQQSDHGDGIGGRTHHHHSAQMPTDRNTTNGADNSVNAIDSRREADRQKILGSGAAKIQDPQAAGGQRSHFQMVASTPMHPSSYIVKSAAQSIPASYTHHQQDGAPPPPSVLHTAPRPLDARGRRGGSYTHSDDQRGEPSDRTPSTAPPPTATTASASSSSYSLQRPPVSSSSFSSSVASRARDARTNTNHDKYNNNNNNDDDTIIGNESGTYSFQSSARRIVGSAAVGGRSEEATRGGAATFGTTRNLNKSLSMVAARSASRLFPQNQHQTSDGVGVSKERKGESHLIANDDDEKSNPIVTLNSLSVGKNTYNVNAHNRYSTISPSVRQPNTSQSQQRDAIKVIREVNAPPQHVSHSHGRRTVEDEKYKNAIGSIHVAGGKTRPNGDLDSEDDDDVLLQDGTYREDHASGATRTSRFHNANTNSKRASVAAATTGANPFFSRATSSATAPSNSSFRRAAAGESGGGPRSMTSASSLTAGIIDGGKKDSHARPPRDERTKGGACDGNERRATSASMLAVSSSAAAPHQITMGRGHFRGTTNEVVRPLLSKFNDEG